MEERRYKLLTYLHLLLIWGGGVKWIRTSTGMDVFSLIPLPRMDIQLLLRFNPPNVTTGLFPWTIVQWLLGFFCNWGIYYRPKRSFGQGNIFTPVCHSVHRGGVPGPGGVYLVPGGGTWSWGGVPGPGGVYLVLGGCTWSWGGVPGPGAVPGPGGVTWSRGVPGPRGVYLVLGGCTRGGCTWSGTPPRTRYPPGLQTPEYGQWSAGTHPTGMHSC